MASYTLVSERHAIFKYILGRKRRTVMQHPGGFACVSWCKLGHVDPDSNQLRIDFLGHPKLVSHQKNGLKGLSMGWVLGQPNKQAFNYNWEWVEGQRVIIFDFDPKKKKRENDLWFHLWMWLEARLVKIFFEGFTFGQTRILI